jgi:glycosyltransferase involved in cell wall biosynthesis
MPEIDARGLRRTLGTTQHQPKVSVVIPTYNKCDVLRETLNNLVRQQMDPRDYEVIVADDGSSDATKTVVESFSDFMTVKYCFQEDLGFRAGAARNAGARLAAAPLLVFVDTGVMIGPGFLQEHLAAHEQSPGPIVVLGYLYGFNPDASVPGLRDALDRLSPEEVVAHYDGDPAMHDVRHEVYVKCDFDLARLSVPWAFFFTNNCSLRAGDFWAAGAFDEAFDGWGGEDLELGYRVFCHGLRYQVVPGAWGIEAPVERDMVTRMGEFRNNMRRFVEKYPEPRIEIGWATVEYYDLLQWEAIYAEFAEWREQVRGLSVADEIDEVMRRVPAGDRIAILGAGGSVPESARNAVLLDFDADLVGSAGDGGPDSRHHAIGLRTPLADRCVDAVIITSRLSGLRGRWNDALLAEAHRIGHAVFTTTTTIAALSINQKRISVRDDRAEAHVALLHPVDDVRDVRHRKDLDHGGDLPARHQGQGLLQVLKAVMSGAEYSLALDKERVIRGNRERSRRVHACQDEPSFRSQAAQGLGGDGIGTSGGEDDIRATGCGQLVAAGDHKVGAELAGEVVLVVGAGDGDGLEPARLGELQRQVAQCADAQHRDPLARPGLSRPQRTPARIARAQYWCRQFRGQPLRKQYGLVGGHDHELGVPALDRETSRRR